MKRKIIFIVLISFTILGFFNTIYADTIVYLDIKTNTNSIYSEEINVAPCDSENDGVMKITAYCALVQSSIVSDWSGLWVNSINGIVNNDNDNGVYWMWLANLNTDNTNPSSSYNLSAKQYILNPNDRILFYYNTNPLNISVNKLNPTVGENVIITVTELGLDSFWNPVWNPAIGGKIIISPETYNLDTNGAYSLLISDIASFSIKGQKDTFIDSPQIIITPALVVVASSGGGGGSFYVPPPVIKPIFDLEKAFKFIISQQKENGSFGENLYTDWTTISLASGENQNQKIISIIKLIKYLSEIKTDNYQLTDYQRHSMALMSLGLNPHNINGKNYIKKITDSFDGKQFGDIEKDNDDIFALIVLQNAGYTKDENIIKNTIAHILSKQKENGSWNESIDMTSAGIQALAFINQDEQVKNALLKAKEFLKQNQKDDGSFGNVSSTAWAIGGILALSEKPEDWIKNNNTPLDYLASMQDSDGGIKNEYLQNKIWETIYAITALSGKTWKEIMQKFEKIEEKITLEKKENEKENKLKSIVNITKNTETKKEIPIKINKKEIPEQKIEKKPQTKERNWFKNFLNKVFNIF